MASPSEKLRALLREDAPRELTTFQKEALRTVLDPEFLLVDLGIEYERRGRELYALCPHPEHDDRNPSWSIRDDPGEERHGCHHCWSCSAEPPYGGDAAALVQTVKGLDRRAALRYLLELFAVETPDEEQLYGLALRRRAVPAPAAEPEEVEEGEERPDRLPRFARPLTADPADPFWTYLLGRGFEPGDLETYRPHGHARSARWRNRVILPVEMDGVLRTYYGRRIDPGCPKKLKGLYPFGKGSLEGTLSGWDHRRGGSVAVLTEGRFDEIYTRRTLPRTRRVRSGDVFSVLGGSMNAARAALLKDYREVIVLGDGDAGGAALARHVYRHLQWTARVYAPELPPGSDPDNLPYEELAYLVDSYQDFPLPRRDVEVLIDYNVPRKGTTSGE